MIEDKKQWLYAKPMRVTTAHLSPHQHTKYIRKINKERRRSV